MLLLRGKVKKTSKQININTHTHTNTKTNTHTPELLKLHGGVFDKLHVAGLDKGLDQLLTQAHQLVAMRHRKSVFGGNDADLFAVDVQKVDVRRERAQQVEDVMAPVVTHDPFAFDRGDELDGFFLVVEHAVRVDLQRLCGIYDWRGKGRKDSKR